MWPRIIAVALLGLGAVYSSISTQSTSSLTATTVVTSSSTPSATTTPLPPSVYAGPSHTVAPFEVHGHTGAYASDPNGDLNSWKWSWVKCTSFSSKSFRCPPLYGLTSGTIPASDRPINGNYDIKAPLYTPTREGNYQLRLTVTDTTITYVNAYTMDVVRNFTKPTLSWSLHPSEPTSTVIMDVSNQGSTDNVVLCEFQVEAKNGDVLLNGIEVDFSVQGSLIANILEEVRLENQNGVILETATSVGTTTIISDFDPDVEVLQNQKVHLRLVARVRDGDNFIPGSAITATVDASGTDARGRTSPGLIPEADRGSDITCRTRQFYVDQPTFTLISTDIVGVDDGAGSIKKANAEIKVKITAQDKDIYLLDFANGGWIAATVPTGFGTTTAIFTSSDASDEGSTWKIPAGQSRNFTYQAHIDNTTSGDGDGFVKLKTTSFSYNTANSISGATTISVGFNAYETNQIFLND